MKILLLLIFTTLTNYSFSQIHFIETFIEGDWIWNSTSYADQLAGAGEINNLEKFEKFKIISFNTRENTFKIREGNKIVKKGTFSIRILTDSTDSRWSKIVEKVLIDVRADKSTPLNSSRDDNYLLTDKLVVVSENGYFPGMCTSWNNYYRLGRDFFNIKLNSQNKEMIRKMVKKGQTKWWFVRDKKYQSEENLL